MKKKVFVNSVPRTGCSLVYFPLLIIQHNLIEKTHRIRLTTKVNTKSEDKAFALHVLNVHCSSQAVI